MTSAEDIGKPDFGFNPTEEQLVKYYLPHKICGNDNKVSAIAEIDNISNYEPWDLPMLAAIPSKHTWYFFSPPDRRYRKSGNNNRLTRTGYWKATGKKREIKNRAKNQVIGIKTIFVFHGGRARDPVWTNWTIHEYQLNPSCSNGRDYVISRLRRKPLQNTLTGITMAEIAPEFMVEFMDSIGQDLTSPIAQQPEIHMGQDPSYVNLQHANSVTDDYAMLLPQFGAIDLQDNNTEAVKLYPAIQDVQLHCGIHAAPDESSLSESLGALHIGDISDTEAVKATADVCLPEMHLMQELSYENLQQTNCVADEYNLLLSQFGTSGPQDNISEGKYCPAIQSADSYCGSVQIAPSDSSPSESSRSRHFEDISDTEAVNTLFACCFETTPGGDCDWVWDWSFQPASAYFS